MERRLFFHLGPQLFGHGGKVQLFQELLDAFGAHHGDELIGVFLLELSIAIVAEHLTFTQPSLFLSRHDDVGFKVKNPLQLAHGNVQELTDAARQALKEPDVGARGGQFNVCQPLATYST